jgi:hypothetical protein
MSKEDFFEWLNTCPAKFEVRDENEYIEVWFSGIDAALVSDRIPQLVSADDENKGVPLTQAEIDTLLTDKTGGMNDEL